MEIENKQVIEKDVRSRVIEALQRYGLKQVDVARETGLNIQSPDSNTPAGVHHSTLSLWLQGKIKGHVVKVEETLDQWLQNLYANKPRFIRNPNAQAAQMKSLTSIASKATSQTERKYKMPAQYAEGRLCL
jgi:transcriptional regulator with XRE-family HTH domain